MDDVDIICFSILGFLCLICQGAFWYECIPETKKYCGCSKRDNVNLVFPISDDEDNEDNEDNEEKKSVIKESSIIECGPNEGVVLI